MNLSRDKIERLTFVKYLHFQAGQQTNLERPLSSSAILTIHDCIECFLQLCFELVTGKSKTSSSNILDTYAEELNRIFYDNKQPQINKAYIKRINDLRNQLKHATIFTDLKQIPNLYTETTLFLTDFTSQVFEITFNQISLVLLINDENIKTHLIESEKYILANELQKAMWSIGKAFYELEKSLNHLEGKQGGNILDDGYEADYMIKYGAQIFGDKDSMPDIVLSENLAAIADDVNRLQTQITDLKTILSLSVDIKEYTFFQQNIPYVSKIIEATSGNVKFWIPDEERKTEVKYNLATVKTCLNFVIELALRDK